MVFLLIPFSNIYKKHTSKYENTSDNFFAYTIFKFKKKNRLTNLKIPRTVDLPIPFSNISKKHTHESENT